MASYLCNGNKSLAETLAEYSASERAEALAGLSEAQAHALLYEWRGMWARPNQIQPAGKWVHWLLLAGRGFGKTKTGAETVREWAREKLPAPIHIVAPTAADIRKVMIEGPSGLMSCYPPGEQPNYQPSLGHLITWPNGNIAYCFSADEPERLRGPQCARYWADEVCLVAGTMVKAEHGDVAIESLRPGTRVWTRKGPRRVLRAWQTSRQAQVYRITTSDGRELTGTAGHPVFANGTFVPLLELVHGAILEVWSDALNGAVKSGGSIAGDTGCPEQERCSTGQFTPPLMDQSRRESTSTTEMETGSTSTLETLRRLRLEDTTGVILHADGMRTETVRRGRAECVR